LAEKNGDALIIGGCIIHLTKILLSMRNLDAAQKLMHKMEIIERESYLTPWVSSQMVAWQVRIRLAKGKLTAALQLAEERELMVGGKPRAIDRDSYTAQFEYLVLTRILLAQGHLDDAQELLGQLLERTQGTGRTTTEIEANCLLALIIQAQGDIDQAITVLKNAC
jgi:hypothetical protein